MTLADMLDPHWWTMDRMGGAVLIVIFVALYVKATFFGDN